MKSLENFQSVQLNDDAMKSVIGGNPIATAVLALAGIVVGVLVDEYTSEGGGSSSSVNYGSTSGSAAGAGAVNSGTRP